MKKIFALVLLTGFMVLMFSASLMAQGGKIVVDESLLTADQLAKAKTVQVKETVSETVSWGREIGTAVKETLVALTDETSKFAETKPGKLAMFLVAWKIMARDVLSMGDKVIGYLIGIPFFAIGLIVVIWSYRRQCFPHRYLKEKGPGFWIWRQKTYGIFDPAGEERKTDMDQSAWVIVHAIAAVAIIIISAITIFS